MPLPADDLAMLLEFNFVLEAIAVRMPGALAQLVVANGTRNGAAHWTHARFWQFAGWLAGVMNPFVNEAVSAGIGGMGDHNTGRALDYERQERRQLTRESL